MQACVGVCVGAAAGGDAGEEVSITQGTDWILWRLLSGWNEGL